MAEHSDIQWPDPALARLAWLCGTWRNTPEDPVNGFVAEYTYELALNGKAVRSHGILGKGKPDAIETEALFGWDPYEKRVFYFDFHGAEQVFRGTVQEKDGNLVTEFERIIGTTGRFKAVDSFLNDNTMESQILLERSGSWMLQIEITLHRVTQ